MNEKTASEIRFKKEAEAKEKKTKAGEVGADFHKHMSALLGSVKDLSEERRKHIFILAAFDIFIKAGILTIVGIVILKLMNA